MNFENAKYTDDTEKTIRVSIDGKKTLVAKSMDNRFYLMMVQQEVIIADA